MYHDTTKLRLGETHIARDDGPVADDDIPRIPGVDAVRVDGRPLRVAGGVHVEVRHGDVLAVGHEGVPELGLAPGDAVDEDVGAVPDGEADGPALAVAAVAVLVHPDLAVAVEEGPAVAAERDVGAAELPRRVQARVLDRQRVGDPVLQVVGAPHPPAVDVDRHVVQVRRLHHLPDVVRPLLEDDRAVRGALPERAEDLRRVVRAPARRHRARRPLLDHFGQGRPEDRDGEDSTAF